MKDERKNNVRKYNNSSNKKNVDVSKKSNRYNDSYKKNTLNNENGTREKRNSGNSNRKNNKDTYSNEIYNNKKSNFIRKNSSTKIVNNSIDNDNGKKQNKKTKDKIVSTKKNNLTKSTPKINTDVKKTLNQKRWGKKQVLNKKNKDFGDKLTSRLFYILVGAVLCNLCFFIITGGRNYIKLYYELREFIEVYDLVTTEYYGEIDKKEVISSAIDAMFVNINDYYTTYVDKDSTETFLEDVNGTYEGIGCMISTNEAGEIFVVEVFDDTSSSKAGLKVNDIILKVDGEDYSSKTSLDMSEYVKNKEAKKIDLTIKREEEVIDVTIEREKIEIPVVNSQVIDYENEKVGYINIDVFSSVSYEQIKSKLKKLEKEDISGLVIDVRDNNGGYLSAVTDISSLFLDKGKVIYRLEDDENSEKIKDETKTSRDYPIAVLVNGSSASASEIFASAIKESYGGFVVGTNTYGKGTVQKTKVLSDGSMVKYTIQKWLTPEGYYLNEVGVTPTNVVELNYELEYDNQLDEALKLIVNSGE